jgi:hypothetical protein
MEAFDERLIDAGVENSKAWFKMPTANREVIKAFYAPLVKVSLDKDGVPKPYPPTFKAALRKKKDDTFDASFYNGTTKPLTEYSRDTPIADIFPKRSQATAIIQCTGVWFAGGKFGTTWKAVQVRVDSRPEQISGPAFRSEAPDISSFMAAKAPAPAAFGGAGAAPSRAREMVVDNDYESDMASAAIIPPRAAAPPAPVVEPFADTDLDSAFDDDSIVAPVPVPVKKVVKKVVKK